MIFRSDIISDICKLAENLPSDLTYYDRPVNKLRDFLLDLDDCLTAQYRWCHDAHLPPISTGAWKP